MTGIVGRAAELAALTAFLDAAAHPRALVLSGSPGIGKTILWQAAVDAARERGMRVLTARPSETETRLSLAGLADLLEDVDDGVLGAFPTPQARALRVSTLPAGGSITIAVGAGTGIFYGATVDNTTGDPSLQIARLAP